MQVISKRKLPLYDTIRHRREIRGESDEFATYMHHQLLTPIDKRVTRLWSITWDYALYPDSAMPRRRH